MVSISQNRAKKQHKIQLKKQECFIKNPKTFQKLQWLNIYPRNSAIYEIQGLSAPKSAHYSAVKVPEQP